MKKIKLKIEDGKLDVDGDFEESAGPPEGAIFHTLIVADVNPIWVFIGGRWVRIG